MPQYFKQDGERLIGLGYPIVPLPPGSKGPRIKGWQNLDITIEQFRRMASNGSADAGTGILSARVPAIDVDIMDADVAEEMNSVLEMLFGSELLARVGQAPKFLVPFRTDEPFRKLSSGRYTDGTHDHRIEILGEGQQWVAFHVHPGTGEPYYWGGGRSILEVPWADLPILTRSDAQRVIDAFEVLAAARVASGVWRLKSHEPVPPPDRPDADAFAPFAQPVTDLTRSQIEWLVHKCDPTDYDRWIDVGMMLNHQYAGGEEGFEIWDAWSSNADNYKQGQPEEKWASFGTPGRNHQTIRALIAEFGQPPAPLRDHPEAKPGDRVPFVEGTHFAEDFQDIDWLVEDVVPRAQTGVIYGASGSGKTFFALDMACAIHRGAVWRGKHVERADAFYIAAEAGNGIKKRIAAYLQFKGSGPMPWFVDYQPNLATLDSIAAISESVKLRSARAGVIFIDTLALSHDGDENSSKDMSLVLRNCKILHDDTGALVVLVHHTGKVESKGMRGSSAIYAGSDFVLEIAAAGRNHSMVVDKLKDGERGAEFPFTLPAVGVGKTPRGKVITSCYVKESDTPPERKNGRKPLTVQAQIFIFDVFKDALGMSDDMTETELVEAVKAKQKEMEYTPSQSQSIKLSINRMVISGHLCKEDERISLPS